jgi:hypothetical protein
MEVIQCNNEVNQRDLKARCHEFNMQLVAVKAQIRHIGDGNAVTSAIMVKTPKFDRPMSWTVFHQQFEAVADHSSQETLEAMHILTLESSKIKKPGGKVRPARRADNLAAIY